MSCQGSQSHTRAEIKMEIGDSESFETSDPLLADGSRHANMLDQGSQLHTRADMKICTVLDLMRRGERMRVCNLLRSFGLCCAKGT
uniref:Uncharacterized protein n=1 Tax=Tanacetum cinerariifolium TaxID=118510 RepID=A0A6L2JZB9_TANCI|nr:hypothetical protein [Tanacetum cinerariifolium]